jgi:hypothetical protein
MNTILNLLKTLLPAVESQSERDEAYLAGSPDIGELELRMRALDERGRNHNGGIAVGLYTR